MCVKRQLLANDRGAAFLLAVYFSALVLLLVGGVSLQRTNTEVRAAQLSRDMQQAFWRSEGAIDSARVLTKTQALTSPDPYDVNQLAGAQFTLEPYKASIYNNNQGENKVKSNMLNPYQIVYKKLIGNGGAIGGKSQTVTVLLREEGPLNGVWANETIAIGGGAITDPDDVFVNGNMFSGRGSVVTHTSAPKTGEPILDFNDTWKTATSGKNILRFDGLIGLTPANPAVTTASSMEKKVENWGAVATDELKGIKKGYEIITGVAGSSFGSQVKGENGVRFAGVGAADTDSSAHVEGLLSVGMFATTDVFGEVDCNKVLTVSGSVVEIDDNFDCDPDHPEQTPGITCDHKVGDKDNSKGKVRLCLKAIVPDHANTSDWGGDGINNPPTIVFKQPTTLQLTGSVPYDLAGSQMSLGAFNLPPFTLQPEHFVMMNMKRKWNLQLSATLASAVKDGSPVPVEIFQMGKEKRADLTYPYPMIYTRPGDIFAGSIYAPQALVVMRGRFCAQDNSCGSSELSLQYIVGNEVAIELEGDKLSIGRSGSMAVTADEMKQQTLMWTAKQEKQ